MSIKKELERRKTTSSKERGQGEIQNNDISVWSLYNVQIQHEPLANPLRIRSRDLTMENINTLGRSGEIAPSALAIQLAAMGAAKGYATPQVLNALRGVGTAQGSSRLIEVGQHDEDFTTSRVRWRG